MKKGSFLTKREKAERRDNLKRLLGNGWSKSDIAAKYNVTTRAVRGWLKRPDDFESIYGRLMLALAKIEGHNPLMPKMRSGPKRAT